MLLFSLLRLAVPSDSTRLGRQPLARVASHIYYLINSLVYLRFSMKIIIELFYSLEEGGAATEPRSETRICIIPLLSILLYIIVIIIICSLLIEQDGEKSLRLLDDSEKHFDVSQL